MNMINGPLHAFVASLLMLGTMLCCYCTVQVVQKLDVPTPAPVQECPARDECWHVCVSMAEIATDNAVRTCTTSVENATLLSECEDQLFELRYDDIEEHCSARIDAMFHEMFWEYRDPEFDEWDDGSTGTP